MNISWKWLSTLVDLSGLTPQELGDRLTMSGLELEKISPFASAEGLKTVVVAHIDSMEQHPNADRLTVCQVDAGEHGTKQIVCGAKNMKPGDKVPLALPKTRLPDGMKIKKSKLRGVKSEGMLCAEDELGIGKGADGLMILPQTLEVGAPVIDALDLADTVLDIAVTPNRPDALSHIGVARDVAALTGAALSWPRFANDWRATCRGQQPELVAVPWPELAADAAETSAADQVKVDIQDAEGCSRYAAAVIDNIKVGPSPQWLCNRLMAIGQRPINNIVDVTNYILHECGQPLHAFDADKIADGQIIVRRATEGEKLTTLDDAERTLLATDLVIADPNGPVALAGVMGGATSEVSETTTRIIIECANFHPSPVRKTARRLGLHSDSSYRFERGVDPAGVPHFIRRAVELIVATQEALGQRPMVAPGIVDVVARPVEARQLPFTAADYARLIGVNLSTERISAVLDALDLTHTIDGETLNVRVPTFRPDIERTVDIIEEIARIEGFDSLPALLPTGTMGFAHQEREEAGDLNQTIVTLAEEQALGRVTNFLLGRGLMQAVNYNFTSSALLGKMGWPEGDIRGHAIKLRNPLSEDGDVMRTSLLPGLLGNLKHNRGHRVSGANLFEIGRAYLRQDVEGIPVPDHFGGKRWGTHAEPLLLGAILADPAWTHHSGAQAWELSDIRSLVDGVVKAISRRGAQLVPFAEGKLPTSLHPYASAQVVVEGIPVGHIGTIHPELLADLKIDGAAHTFELDLSRLLDLKATYSHMAPISRFPTAQRDFALALSDAVPYADVEAALANYGDARLVGHRLMDVYSGEQVGEGRRSLAIRVTFRNPEGTLSDSDLAELHQGVIDHLTKALDAELR